MVDMVRRVVFCVRLGFGSLQDGEAGFSFVGCFWGRFSKGEDESDITFEEFVRDGSFARMFWILMAKAASISSIFLAIRSAI